LVSPLLLLALAASGPNDLRLAAVGFSSPNLPPNITNYYAAHIAHQMTLEGITVSSPEEVGTLIGAERQRQLLGCSESSSCLVEIASALGSGGIVTGTIAKFGNETQIDIKVLSATDGRPLVTFSGLARSDSEVLDVLGRAASGMVSQLRDRFHLQAPAPVSTVSSSTGSRAHAWAWLPLAAGAVLAGAGTVSYIEAKSSYDDLVNNKPGINAPSTASTGSNLQTASAIMFVAAGASVATGAALLLISAPQERISVRVSPSGLFVSGTLP
jgi:hypothetical protein